MQAEKEIILKNLLGGLQAGIFVITEVFVVTSYKRLKTKAITEEQLNRMVEEFLKEHKEAIKAVETLVNFHNKYLFNETSV